jgi:hypothetical protein
MCQAGGDGCNAREPERCYPHSIPPRPPGGLDHNDAPSRGQPTLARSTKAGPSQPRGSQAPWRPGPRLDCHGGLPGPSFSATRGHAGPRAQDRTTRAVPRALRREPTPVPSHPASTGGLSDHGRARLQGSPSGHHLRSPPAGARSQPATPRRTPRRSSGGFCRTPLAGRRHDPRGSRQRQPGTQPAPTARPAVSGKQPPDSATGRPMARPRAGPRQRPPGTYTGPA